MNLRLILLSAILFSIYVSLVIVILFLPASTPIDASVLYGAQPEDNYAFVGYVMIDNEDGTVSICGVNFISDRIAITAAHCLETAEQLYPNTGEVSAAYRQRAFSVNRFLASPDYKGFNYLFSAGEGDIGLIELGESVRLPEYATYSEPDIGCGYYITGYGRNEDGQTYERKGGSVCISQLNDERFELSTQGQVFFCQGDSGSGIYKADTNKLVGIVSSFAQFDGSNDCETASNFYATRIDTNQSFINRFTSSITPLLSVPENPSATNQGFLEESVVDNSSFVNVVGNLYVNTIESVGIETVILVYTSIVVILVIITVLESVRFSRRNNTIQSSS